MAIIIKVANKILEDTIQYYINTKLSSIQDNIEIIEDTLITEDTNLTKNTIILTSNKYITDSSRYANNNINIVYMPFNINVLINKIEEIQNKKEVYYYDNMILEISFNKGTLKYKDKLIEYTIIESLILKLLFINKNKEISKEEISTSIWGNNLSTKLLDTHIYNIRQKLQKNTINLQIEKLTDGFILKNNQIN